MRYFTLLLLVGCGGVSAGDVFVPKTDNNGYRCSLDALADRPVAKSDVIVTCSSQHLSCAREADPYYASLDRPRFEQIDEDRNGRMAKCDDVLRSCLLPVRMLLAERCCGRKRLLVGWEHDFPICRLP